MAPRAARSPDPPQTPRLIAAAAARIHPERPTRVVRRGRHNRDIRASGKVSLYPLERRPTPLHALLHNIVETIEPARVRDSVRNVFDDLNRLLGYVEQLKATLDN